MELKELITLLKTVEIPEEINIRRNEIVELIPAVKVMLNFDQQNHAHQFDLWMHSLNVVVNLPKNLDDDMLYLALCSMISESWIFPMKYLTSLADFHLKNSI